MFEVEILFEAALAGLPTYLDHTEEDDCDED